MPLEGRQLTIQSALAACRAAGWSGRYEVITAVSVMSAESLRFVRAWHLNEDGSIDRGVFQINDRAHPDLDDDAAYHAATNILYAQRLWRAQGFKPWAAFTSGRAALFADEVTNIYTKGGWRLRVPLWQARMT